MARPGITYADVAKAAAEMADGGKSVTVDSVREALGSTGSKSTIAPLVKRWKAEHEARGAPASGLPSHLLEAVTALNERVRADADLRIQALTEAHEKALAELRERLGESDARGVALTQERDALASQLADLSTRCEGHLQRNQALQLDVTKGRADIEGLKERLADRGTEIDGLRGQIAKAREQFEHYQRSVAAQRTEERQQGAQRVARLDQDLTETRLHLAAANIQATQVSTRLEQSNQRTQQQDAELATLQSDHQQLIAERQVLTHRVSDLGERNAALESRLHSAMEAQASSHAAIAVARHAQGELESRFKALESRFAEINAENRTLLRKNALLQGQLDARPARPN